MRIYVASSWRNLDQPEVVWYLRRLSHEVYDFRHPRPGDTGFSWGDISREWKGWNPRAFREGLESPIAKAGFAMDYEAMQWAEAFVLVQPCGRSAHLELGWAVGAGKRTVILLANGEEPELMYRLVDHVCLDLHEVGKALEV